MATILSHDEYRIMKRVRRNCTEVDDEWIESLFAPFTALFRILLEGKLLTIIASFWKVICVLNLAPFFMWIDRPILHLFWPNLGRLPS